MAKASVIIPVYNEEHSIGATIESVLRQTRPPDEIVVADGGSMDRTVEIVRRYDSVEIPVRVVENPRRLVGAGRNAAIGAARFDVIAAIDAGNVADVRWLEHLLDSLEGHTIDVVVSGRIMPQIRSCFEACVAGVLFEYLLIPAITDDDQRRRAAEGKDLVSSSSIAFPRTVWQKVGGYPEWLSAAEDGLFVNKLKTLGVEIIRQPDAVVYHHMRSDIPALFRQGFRYGRWSALSAQTSGNVVRLGARYLVVLGLAIAVLTRPGAVTTPAILGLLAAAGAVYVYRRGFCPFMAAFGRLRGAWSMALIPMVLLTRDVSLLLGQSMGSVEHRMRKRPRCLLREYLG